MNPIRHAFGALLIALTATSYTAAQDTIPWIQDLAQARRLAEQQQRLVLLHFWSDHCAPCQHVETNVFNQPELIRVISTGFIPVKIHAQQQPKIVSFYKVDRFPMDVIVLPSGAEVFRTVSPAKPNSYIAMLDQVRSNAVTNGLQEINRVADRADRIAQRIQQSMPVQPTLPPRQGDDEPAQQFTDVSHDPAAPAAGDDWRNAPTNVKPSDRTRGTVVNNEFVGPLDAKPEPKTPVNADVQRRENPYLDKSAGTANPYVSEGAQNSPPAQDNSAGVAPTDSSASGARPWQQSADVAPNNPTLQQPGPTVPPAQEPTSGFGMRSQPNANPAQGAPVNQQPQGPTGPVAGPQLDQSTSKGPALPPNVPPLALDGFCPVTLMEGHKWEAGNPQFGAIHRGRTYLFRSQAERDRFLTAADHYAPVLSGYDPVRFTELQQTVEGNRAFGVVYDQHIYLFADEQALMQFEQQPNKYVNVVRQAMAHPRGAPPQR